MQNLLFETRDANFILFGDVSRLNALNIFYLWYILDHVKNYCLVFFRERNICGGFWESFLSVWLWGVGRGEGRWCQGYSSCLMVSWVLLTTLVVEGRNQKAYLVDCGEVLVTTIEIYKFDKRRIVTHVLGAYYYNIMLAIIYGPYRNFRDHSYWIIIYNIIL